MCLLSLEECNVPSEEDRVDCRGAGRRFVPISGGSVVTAWLLFGGTCVSPLFFVSRCGRAKIHGNQCLWSLGKYGFCRCSRVCASDVTAI